MIGYSFALTHVEMERAKDPKSLILFGFNSMMSTIRAFESMENMKNSKYGQGLKINYETMEIRVRVVRDLTVLDVRFDYV